MSYHPTECIVDLIAASGPQDFSEIVRECNTQCAPVLPAGSIRPALVALTMAGLIVYDGGAFELTPQGDDLIQDWIENGNVRAKAARMARETKTSGFFTIQFDFGQYAGELSGPDIKLWEGTGLPVYEGSLEGCEKAYPEAIALLLQKGFIKPIE